MKINNFLYQISLGMVIIASVICGVFAATISVDQVFAQEKIAARVNPLDELSSTGKKAVGSSDAVDPRGIIFIFIGAFLSLIGLCLTILIMYAGFLWFTARGNEDQVTKAKATLRNAVIGMIIVAMSYALVTFLVRALFNPQPGVSCAEMFDLQQGSATEIIVEQVTPFCGS